MSKEAEIAPPRPEYAPSKKRQCAECGTVRGPGMDFCVDCLDARATRIDKTFQCMAVGCAREGMTRREPDSSRVRDGFYCVDHARKQTVLHSWGEVQKWSLESLVRMWADR